MPKRQLETERQISEVDQYRRFARRQGRLLGESAPIPSAMAEFAVTEFLASQSGASPTLRDRRTRDIIYKLALSTEEVAQARKLGRDAFVAYRAIKGEASPAEIRAFSPEAAWMYQEDPEHRKRERDQAKQLSGKRSLRGRLESSFKELMRLSDNELRIQNSNQRVNFEGDSTYVASYNNRRTAYRNRSLTVIQYKTAGGTVSEAEDVLKLRGKGIGGAELIAKAVESLEADRVHRDSLGEGRFAQFNSLVIALLSGETLSVPQIRSLGFDPEEILRRAGVRHTHFYAVKHDFARDVRKKAWQEYKELAR